MPGRLIRRVICLNGREMELNWEQDPYLKRFLQNRPKSTAKGYRATFREYVTYTSMTPEELITKKP